jgi:hypothetical protein
MCRRAAGAGGNVGLFSLRRAEKTNVESRQGVKHRTSNVEWETLKKRRYDLEERVLEYSVSIIEMVEQLRNTRAGNHVAGRLLKPGT